MKTSTFPPSKNKYMDTKQSFMAPELTQNGSHTILTNVYKESKKKYINIDTRFQLDYSSSNEKGADVIYDIPQAITNVKSIKVTHIEIPASFYNFSFQRNNTFFSIELLNTNNRVLININDGNYTLPELATEIKSELDVAKYKDQEGNNVIGFPDISVNVDVINHKIELESSNRTYTLRFDVNSVGESDKKNMKSNLGWILGFRNPSYELKPGESLVSEAFVDINHFHYLFIALDEYSNTNPNSFLAPSFKSYISPNVLARISLDSNLYSFGSIISASAGRGNLLSDTRQYKGKTNLQRFHLQVLDEWGNVVNLNQMDFSFVLEIECE